MPRSKERTFRMETFGSYAANLEDVLVEALAWSREHPDVKLAWGAFSIDEGYYLNIFYEVEDEVS